MVSFAADCVADITLTSREAAAIVSGIKVAILAAGGVPEQVRDSLESAVSKIDGAFGFGIRLGGEE